MDNHAPVTPVVQVNPTSSVWSTSSSGFPLLMLHRQFILPNETEAYAIEVPQGPPPPYPGPPESQDSQGTAWNDVLLFQPLPPPYTAVGPVYTLGGDHRFLQDIPINRQPEPEIGGNSEDSRQEAHLAVALILACLCCPLIGMVAMYCLGTSDEAVERGDMLAARRRTQATRCLVALSFAVGLTGLMLMCIFAPVLFSS